MYLKNLALDSCSPAFIRTSRDAGSSRIGKGDCRLLYLIGGLHTGGSERQLYYLLSSIDRERYRPRVVVWSYREEDAYVPLMRSLGIPLHAFSPALHGYQKLWKLRCLIAQLKPEVIHSYSFYTNFAAWYATLGTPTIAVGALRSDFDYDRNASGAILGQLSLRWPGTQIYNSAAAAEQAARHRRWILPRRVLIVRNGLDLEEFQAVPLSMNGPARILGVGSLLRVKRWDRLLAAAASLQSQGLDFRVEICGDGPLRENLKERAQTLGVAGRVCFLGQRGDVAKLLARSTFLAHTADSEGCPNAIMEAMACARAVVAMGVGDIPSLVQDGKTGFVVRRGDDAAFANRMAKLITDRTLSLRLGEAGRAQAEREFGITRLVDDTLSVYRDAGWRDFC